MQINRPDQNAGVGNFMGGETRGRDVKRREGRRLRKEGKDPVIH